MSCQNIDKLDGLGPERLGGRHGSLVLSQHSFFLLHLVAVR